MGLVRACARALVRLNAGSQVLVHMPVLIRVSHSCARVLVRLIRTQVGCCIGARRPLMRMVQVSMRSVVRRSMHQQCVHSLRVVVVVAVLHSHSPLVSQTWA